ncbi:MAG: hypothetical protein H0S85_10200 [Desulfovibrionaceae bacterium]|jgi:hypothetical protein|nr:hypothetical protein [Desulfovibrionaceae bacterium]
MKRTGQVLPFVAVLCLLGAGAAFAGSSRVDMLCRWSGAQGHIQGKIAVEMNFWGQISKTPKEAVAECNSKYTEGCREQCWACQQKQGADAVFNTCWGPNDQCIGADCGKW